MKFNKYSELLGNLAGQHLLIDDFFEYTDTERWTKLAADAGSSVAIAASTDAGILQLITGAVDNNEAEVYATNAVWKGAAGKSWYAEALIQFSEANTNAANVAFGFCSANGANVLLDNGGGVAATYSGALIYKLDGGTVWRCNSSNGTTQTDTISGKTAGGSSYQKLGIEARDVDGSNYEVTFFVDDLPLYDSTFRRPIKQSVALSGLLAMRLLAYVKAGSGSSETLNVDYLAALKAR